MKMILILICAFSFVSCEEKIKEAVETEIEKSSQIDFRSLVFEKSECIIDSKNGEYIDFEAHIGYDKNAKTYNIVVMKKIYERIDCTAVVEQVVIYFNSYSLKNFEYRQTDYFDLVRDGKPSCFEMDSIGLGLPQMIDGIDCDDSYEFNPAVPTYYEDGIEFDGMFFNRIHRN